MFNHWHCCVIIYYRRNKYQFVDRVAKVGNAMLASSSGVDVPGVTFLLNDMILTEGVVFAFSAYIRSNKPVHFQIWRSVVNGTNNSYRLIGYTRVVPSVNNDREDVSSFPQLRYFNHALNVINKKTMNSNQLDQYVETTKGRFARRKQFCQYEVDDENRYSIIPSRCAPFYILLHACATIV